MDEIDQQIIERLQEDSRAAFTEIADDLDVSEGTVRNRVEQLQEDGIIERFTIDVAPDHDIGVFVMVELDTDRDIDAVLDAFPAELELYEVTGDWDVIAKFGRDSSRAVNQTLEAIRRVDGVVSTTTYTVLTERSS